MQPNPSLVRALHQRALPLAFALGLLMLTAGSAHAGSSFGIDVDCPETVSVGQNVAATVTLESSECFITTARIITSIIGNGSDTVGGLGVFGPVVADPHVSIPAATDLSPPYCDWTSPGSTTNPMLTAPTVDASLSGTVISVLFMVEFEGGLSVVVDQCLVEVTS